MTGIDCVIALSAMAIISVLAPAEQLRSNTELFMVEYDGSNENRGEPIAYTRLAAVKSCTSV